MGAPKMVWDLKFWFLDSPVIPVEAFPNVQCVNRRGPKRVNLEVSVHEGQCQETKWVEQGCPPM